MSRTASALFCLLIALTLADALSGSRASLRNASNIRRVSPTSKSATQTQLSSGDTAKLNSEKPKSSSGISAWGIVALIISFILLCMGTYYTVLFYPLLCAKERKYDIIDLSPV